MKNSELEPELKGQRDLIKAVARAPIDDLEPVAEALCELVAEVRVTGNPGDRVICVTNPHNIVFLERSQCDTDGRLTITHISILKRVNAIVDGVDGRVLVAALESMVDELINALLSLLAIADTLTALPVGGHRLNLLGRERFLERYKDRVVERGLGLRGLRVH